MKQVWTTHNFHAFDVTHDAKIWQTSTIKISPVKSHKHIYVTSIVQNKLIGILYKLKTYNFLNIKCHTFELKRNLKNGIVEINFDATIVKSRIASRNKSMKSLEENQIDLIIIGWQKNKFFLYTHLSPSNTICYHEVIIFMCIHILQ